MLQAATASPDWRHLSEAAAFAFGLHASQMRKGTNIPYLSHLMGVASIVLEHGGDEEQAIAGLLHDAIEDCGAEQEAVIRMKFGDRVATIVRGCTDTDVQPKPPWRVRKEAYIAHLYKTTDDIRLVSCADKLHNARSIVMDVRTHGVSMFGRFNAGQEGTLWYYTSLSAAFAETMPGTLSRELSAAVADMQCLASACGQANRESDHA
ncbi:MAG: HD domain-containing protein [Rhodospirillales bacterium]